MSPSFGGRTNVLIVGSGGREHALAWKIQQSVLAREVFVAPGNGGTHGSSVPIYATDTPALVEFAKRKECFTIVGPEVPLSLGIVDRFLENELPIFGPTQEQAKIETSKSYAKNIMQNNDIPTAQFGTFVESSEAAHFASKFDGRVAVKADGLASGKGVFVCSSMKEAETAIKAILEQKLLGDAGNSIVVEEKLEGREISLMTICNGKDAIPFGTATDHKRLLDDDRGPNTGGMGAYSPSTNFDNARTQEVMKKVVMPIVNHIGFSGFLYAGLVVTESGFKVLEFNARMGDPETQAILPRLDCDLMNLILTAWKGELLVEAMENWHNLFACTVAMCARGYPNNPKTGDEIKGLEKVDSQTIVFHSGTKRSGNKLLTAGGRVVYVTALGRTLLEASNGAYDSVEKISWAGEYHRTDIGRTPQKERYEQSGSKKNEIGVSV